MNIATSSNFFQTARMALQNAQTSQMQAARALKLVKEDEETSKGVVPEVSHSQEFLNRIMEQDLWAESAKEVHTMSQSAPESQTTAQRQAADALELIKEKERNAPQAPTQDSIGGDIGEPIINENKSVHVSYEESWIGYEHPAPLMTTATFNHAQRPFDHDLIHPNLIKANELSAAQVDGVGYATDAALKGKSALLGDGTGVGKGRQLAAFIRNNNLWKPNSVKHIIITANPILFHDFKRDLIAIGVRMVGRDALPLKSVTEWNANESIGMSRGILFVSYGALRVAAKGGKDVPVGNKRPAKQKKTRSRLEQIIEWAGSNFDGVVAFDEIHNCKDHKSLTSIAALELQNKLPNSKVIYSSATAMSKIEHLAAMPRLGLWGANTPYPDYKSFLASWNSQTRSALEIIGTELASQGLYLSRSLSFEGTKFTLVHANMTPEQSATHTRLCAWWKKLISLDGVLAGKKNRAIMWGSHLRFFKALLVAYRVDLVAERAADAISKGMSVVISLIGTGEQAAKRFAEEDDGDDDSASDGSGFVALSMTMESIIDLAIKEYIAEQGPNGSNLAAMTELKEDIKTFDLPPSPLDYMIHKLSLINVRGECEMVAEMTGRAKGFYASSDGKWHLKNRPMSNLEACQAFQKGKIVVAVISAAAATGISLQNTTSAPDRPRMHLIVELAWAADQALQALGRTHRADQHNAPHYNLVVSNMEAEGRFAATVSKRASDMGAVTTGDRRGTNQEKTFGSDLLIGTHSHEGLRMLLSCVFTSSWPIWLSHNPDEDWAGISKQVAQVIADMRINQNSKPRHLLGRLLGIPMTESNMCMRIYEAACIESQLSSDARKKQNGVAVDLGVEDMCIGEKASIVSRKGCGGICEVAVDIGIDFDMALKKGLDWKTSGSKMSFFKRKETPGLDRSYIVLALLNKPRVECFRPNGRHTRYFLQDFKKFYSEIGSKDGLFEKGSAAYNQAKESWDDEYEMSLRVCSHGSSCHYGAACTFGKREVHSTLVKMPGAVNRLHGHVASKSSFQIIRLDDNESESGSSSSDNVNNKCVAVRIGRVAQDRLEAASEAEKQRKKTEDLAYQKAKSELLKDMASSSEPVDESNGHSEDCKLVTLSSDEEDEDSLSSDDEESGESEDSSGKRQRKVSSDEESLSDSENC